MREVKEKISEAACWLFQINYSNATKNENENENMNPN